MNFDPRFTPARPDLAAAHLQGRVEAMRFVEGVAQEVIAGHAPLRQEPSHGALMFTEALHGELVMVYESDDEGWAWGQLMADGYVGWLPAATLLARSAVPTHKVSALRTLVFPGPSIKLPTTNALPFGELQRDVNWMRFRLAAESEGERKWAVAPAVTNGYFEVLGIRLARGRVFQPGDAASGAIVINESMARRFWPAGNAIGGTLVLQQEHRIVGIVRDVVFTTSFSPEPTIYRPIDAAAVPRLVFSAANAAAAQAIVEHARRIDPRVRVTPRTLEAALDRRFSGSRTAAMVASILGILSVALASVGVFGVFRYSVQQRTREIGIRMALGARPGQVVAHVARSGSRPLIAGLGIGLGAAIAAGQVIRSGLHGLSPLDPLAFGGAAAILALAASAAVYLPSRRATRVEPVVALRSE